VADSPARPENAQPAAPDGPPGPVSRPDLDADGIRRYLRAVPSAARGALWSKRLGKSCQARIENRPPLGNYRWDVYALSTGDTLAVGYAPSIEAAYDAIQDWARRSGFARV
jgi:hypothetical protein